MHFSSTSTKMLEMPINTVILQGGSEIFTSTYLPLSDFEFAGTKIGL